MIANRKLTDNYFAITAVIGVVLMVAITIAIGAVTFVYFSGLAGVPTEEKENAAIAVVSDNGRIKITLISGGDKMPNDGYSFADSVTVRLNGRVLDESGFLPTNTGWELGESMYIGDATPTLSDVRSAVTGLPAADYSLTVTIIKTVIYDDLFTIV